MTQSRFIPICLAALLGVLYGIGAQPVHAAAPPKPLVALNPAKPAPDVGFTDEAGKRHPLSAFKGKPVLVNLWATWCAPCVAELPALARLKAAVPTMTVLAVDVGRDTPAQAEAFLKEHKAQSLGTYVDTEKKFIAAFRAYGMPTTVLLDAKGNMIARAEGPAEWDSREFVAYFKTLK